MVAILFVACDNNDNNNDDNNDDNGTNAASSDVVVTEGVTVEGGEDFVGDNEAMYKDSWK